MEPTTFRLDTEPCTDAPMTLTEPDPLLASSVNGTEDSVAMSTLPYPAEAIQSRRGTPTSATRPLWVAAMTAARMLLRRIALRYAVLNARRIITGPTRV
jgi:hypothetical protein